MSYHTIAINLPRFHRREITLGPLLQYRNDKAKFYAIESVHLRPGGDNHILRQEVADSPRLFAAMLLSDDTVDEAQLLADLKHEHIARVCGVYTTRSNVLLIVERMVCTLADYLQEWFQSSAPSLTERLSMAHQLSLALQYLHSNQICLRELHPGNIGFNMKGNLKLFDFSRAKKVVEMKKLESYDDDKSCGDTVNEDYAAPEVAMGKPFGLEADVFSFGIVFWELLMLLPACVDDTEEYRLTIKNSDVPSGARDVVRQSLCRDASKRTAIKDIQIWLGLVVEDEERKTRLAIKKTKVLTSSCTDESRRKIKEDSQRWLGVITKEGRKARRNSRKERRSSRKIRASQ